MALAPNYRYRALPEIERLSVDDVMKGHSIAGEELDRMLAVTHNVVGKDEAEAELDEFFSRIASAQRGA